MSIYSSVKHQATLRNNASRNGVVDSNWQVVNSRQVVSDEVYFRKISNYISPAIGERYNDRYCR